MKKNNVSTKLIIIKQLGHSFLQNTNKLNLRKDTTKYLLTTLFSSLTGLSLATTVSTSRALGQPTSTSSDYLFQEITECVNSYNVSKNPPSPCTYVDPTKTYGVKHTYNDRVTTIPRDQQPQYLLIPTAQITGIEDPKLSTTNPPFYWQYAWDVVYNTLGKPGSPQDYVPLLTAVSGFQYRDQIGLAVNSQDSRSDNQLHIHMSCVKREVREALGQSQYTTLTPGKWSQPANLNSSTYKYRVTTADSLSGANNPFYLVSQNGSGQAMAHHTIAVTGKRGGGFYIVDSDPGINSNRNPSAEELLDESCQNI